MKKTRFISIISMAILPFFLSGCNIDENSFLNSGNITPDSYSEGSGNGKSVNAVVSYIDIGQGDSELIESGGYSILIDGGEKGSGDEIISYLEERGISKLDYVIASHPHSDHIGGLTDIMYSIINEESDIEIGTVVMSDLDDSVVPTTKVYTYFLEDIDKLGIDLKIVEEQEEISLASDNSMLTLIPSPFTDDDNLNNESIVTVFRNGENTFLFTGDAEKEEEKALVETGALNGIDADVYKAGHHGSSNASSEELLSLISPSYTVISCGAGNSYGHPHEESLERISDCGSEILRTDLLGTIVFSSDGENISYESEK